MDSAVVGKAAVVLGGSGLTLQWITSFGSLAVICINILVGLAGLYLVTLKIRNERKGRRP